VRLIVAGLCSAVAALWQPPFQLRAFFGFLAAMLVLLGISNVRAAGHASGPDPMWTIKPIKQFWQQRNENRFCGRGKALPKGTFALHLKRNVLSVSAISLENSRFARHQEQILLLHNEKVLLQNRFCF
jgi:hypothetical protein